MSKDQYGERIVRIGQLELTALDRNLRMSIRNAWLAESKEDIQAEAMGRAAQGKWFEAAVLLELACEARSEDDGPYIGA